MKLSVARKSVWSNLFALLVVFLAISVATPALARPADSAGSFAPCTRECVADTGMSESYCLVKCEEAASTNCFAGCQQRQDFERGSCLSGCSLPAHRWCAKEQAALPRNEWSRDRCSPDCGQNATYSSFGEECRCAPGYEKLGSADSGLEIICAPLCGDDEERGEDSRCHKLPAVETPSKEAVKSVPQEDSSPLLWILPVLLVLIIFGFSIRKKGGKK